MATLLTGFVLGAGRLILELVHGADQTGLPSGSVWAAIAEFNFLHFAVVLFLICAAVLVGVSLIGARPKPEKIEGLTWANVDAGEKRVEELPRLRSRSRWRRIDTVASVVLALLVLALWIHFEQ